MHICMEEVQAVLALVPFGPALARYAMSGAFHVINLVRGLL